MGFGRDRDEYPASSVAEAIRCARASSRRASPSPTHPIARLAETTERTHDGSRDASPPRRASRRPVPSLPPSSRRFPSAVGVLDDLATSAPGVAAAATSAAAFVLTANAARRAAYATGVSCATPILGVAWGLCATAGASVVAGQAARAALEASRSGGGGWSGSVGVADVANAARVGWSSFASSSSSARSGFFRGALGGLGGSRRGVGRGRDDPRRDARHGSVRVHRTWRAQRAPERRLAPWRDATKFDARERSALRVRCVLYKSCSPIVRFQHLIASPFN